MPLMGLREKMTLDSIMEDLAQIKNETAILANRISQVEKENASINERLHNMDVNVSIVLDDLDERVTKLNDTLKAIESLLAGKKELPITTGTYR